MAILKQNDPYNFSFPSSAYLRLGRKWTWTLTYDPSEDFNAVMLTVREPSTLNKLGKVLLEGFNGDILTLSEEGGKSIIKCVVESSETSLIDTEYGIAEFEIAVILNGDSSWTTLMAGTVRIYEMD